MVVAVPVGVGLGLFAAFAAEKTHHHSGRFEGCADLRPVVALALCRTAVRVADAFVGAVSARDPVQAGNFAGNFFPVHIGVAIIGHLASGSRTRGGIGVVSTRSDRAQTEEEEGEPYTGTGVMHQHPDWTTPTPSIPSSSSAKTGSEITPTAERRLCGRTMNPHTIVP